MTPLDRFLSKVLIDKQSGCWEWTAAKMPNGYAQFRYSPTKNGYGHRFAYEQFKGPIPPDRQLDHLCKNKGCVNPEHLEIVTPKENIARVGPRRSANGEKTHCKRGHPLSGDNLYINPGSGGRVCLACRLEYQREYQRRWQAEKYTTDPEFRERAKARQREYTRRAKAEKP